MSSPASPAAVAAAVGDVTRRLVVLDFDGTLSPIVDIPGGAALAPGARDAVDALCSLTDVAVLTGRFVSDVLPRLEGLPVTVVGNHGTEARLLDGRTEVLLDTSAAVPTLDAVEAALLELVDEDAGWQVERKPTSVAVHHRRVEDAAATSLLPRVRALLREHLERPPGWKLLRGHAVDELAPSGADKGTALRWLREQHEREGVLVVGDDVTDEDAFAAATATTDVSVLVAEEQRPTAADLRLRSPAEVVAMLELLASGR